MRVTYLKHSGFLLEWERCYWIFDYYQGQIPALDPKKTIFVFCSHSHSDHFNPAVFRLREQYPAVQYVFSGQVRPACRKWNRKSDMDSQIPVSEVHFLASRTEAEFSDGFGGTLKIFALRSTDCGCAFRISYEGKTIYHAGDLHWWFWPGESETENRQMTGNFKKEMEYLEGLTLDAAFVPLDGRLGETYGLGMRYLLEHARVRHVFPMHFWDDFSVMDRYPEEYPVPEHTEFHKILADGQCWELPL